MDGSFKKKRIITDLGEVPLSIIPNAVLSSLSEENHCSHSAQKLPVASVPSRAGRCTHTKSGQLA